MISMSVLFSKLLSMSLIGSIGFLLAKKDILAVNDKQSLSILINKVCLPLLLLTSIANIKLNSTTLFNASIVMLFAYICMLGNYLFSTYLTKKYRLAQNQASVVINGAVNSNVAFFAFPILYALFQDVGVFYGAIYFLADSTILWTLGIKRFLKAANIQKKAFHLNIVTSALLIGIVLMIVGSITKVDFSTNIFYSTFHDVGSITTILAMIFLGLIIYENSLISLIKNRLTIELLCFKLLIWPLLIAIFLLILKLDIDPVVQLIIMIQIAMPPFASLITLSYEYKQDMHYASSLVVLGHIAAIITLPLLFFIIEHLSNII